MAKSKRTADKDSKSGRAEDTSSAAGPPVSGDSPARQGDAAALAEGAAVSQAPRETAAASSVAADALSEVSPAKGPVAADAPGEVSPAKGSVAADAPGEVSPAKESAAADAPGEVSPAEGSVAADAPGQQEIMSPAAQRQLEQLRAEWEQEISAMRETMLRQVADARNELTAMRQRAQKEQESLRLHAVQDIAYALLPVLDDLERATAEAAHDGEGARHLAEGMGLIHRKMLEVFGAFNIRREHPEGGTLDPSLHEAVSALESKDAAPNTVLQVLQSGYQLHDRLLRPARVVVAKEAVKRDEDEQAV